MWVGGDVIGNPATQPFFAILSLHKGPNFVASNHLEKVRNSRCGHHVWQPSGDRRVCRGLWAIVLLGLLRCLRTEEHRVIGVLVVAQRQKTELGKLRLAAVGDGNLRWALEHLVAVVGHKHVRRKTLHLAAIFSSADRRAPARFCKGIGELGT